MQGLRQEEEAKDKLIVTNILGISQREGVQEGKNKRIQNEDQE